MSYRVRPTHARRVACLAFLFALSCCSKETGIKADTSAERMVLEHVSSHFEVELDAEEDRQALELFLGKTTTAAGPDDMIAAWDAVPSLKAKGDVLQAAFASAKRDGSWPADAPDSAFVSGTRKAVQDVLDGGD